jgi:beta-lactamase superfamily II metal-dependent hydrolase
MPPLSFASPAAWRPALAVAALALAFACVPALSGGCATARKQAAEGSPAGTARGGSGSGGLGSRGDSAEGEAPGLEIYVFSMGQADSMLFVGPPPGRRTLLVDLGETIGGDKNNHHRVLRRIVDITGKPWVDYLLITHFHQDHMGAPNKDSSKATGIFGLLDDPLAPFKVGTLFDRGDDVRFSQPTSRHRDYLIHVDEWKAAGVVKKRVTPKLGTQSIDLGPGVTVEVLAVSGRVAEGDEGAMAGIEAAFPGTYAAAPANENDYSVAIEVQYGDFEIFTGGDLNGAAVPPDGRPLPAMTNRSFGNKGETYTNVEAWMVKRWKAEGRESDVEVYRADHHGSEFSSTPMLVDALDPEFILYSCGGMYGHPKPAVVERGAKTAVQLVTSSVSSESWPTGLPTELGEIVGEIVMEVAADGRSWTLNGRPQRAWTDAEEAANEDVRPDWTPAASAATSADSAGSRSRP